jgi:hypothetical protein
MRETRPSWTNIWMAHHCVQPWQVLATQVPFAGVLGRALRGTSAALNGMPLAFFASAAIALPPSAQVADAAVA